MAPQKRSDNWVWKHVFKLNNFFAQCNNCDRKYKIADNNIDRVIESIKRHLYHKHRKYDEEDRLKWENSNDLIWRYFDRNNLYTVKCKFCGYFINRSNVPFIKLHLQSHHQEIRAGIQKEIADKSLSQYFEIYEEEFNARCKHCNIKLDIFYGTDILIYHICFKKNKSLRSRQESEDNDMNRITQQSIVDENINSSTHHDDINRALGNQENQQSNTSRYCKNITQAAQEESDDWMWEYVSKLNNFTVQCNNCNKIYSNKRTSSLIISIKAHLYHKHKIWTEEDRLKWKNDNNLTWQYVDKVDLYKGKCKFCKNICNGAYMSNINLHLRKEHSQEIRAAVQKEIANKSLSQYFEVDEEKFIARCKCCNVILNIFYGIDALIHHFCEMNKSLRSRQEPEDNDVNRMTQQSIVTENANTSFHHDDINRQAHHDNLNRALGNQENQQSNTSRYCKNITAAQEESDDWMWEYVSKLNNFTVQCNNCNKIYSNKHTSSFITTIKLHLYHKHEICTEKDRLKWENDNNLIWQYVDKVDLYKGKCKFCKNICNGAYMNKINLHLRKEHSQEIRATVQKEIANKSLSQYFEVDEEKFTALCKCCNVILDIFYGTDALIHHFCEKNKSLRTRQEPEDNDVNRMTQQSIVTENANTSFHHDDINRQAHHDNLNRALGNQENQQSNTSRYCKSITAAREESDDWMWEYVSKLNNSTVQCNKCNKIYYNKRTSMLIISIKAHLYHKHEIWTEKDRLKWENDNNLTWQYVDKVDLYKGKCKFCKNICNGAYMNKINLHLRKEHSQEIRATVQKEIANKSLSQYFEVDEEKFTALCKCCNVILDIFYGTDALIHHFCEKNKSLRTRQEPEDNDVDRSTQSIVTENANTSFHHDDINRQAHHDNLNRALGNQENQQSNTSGYCKNITAAREESDDWMWEYVFKLNNSVRCNKCKKIYYNKRTNMLIISIKAHLYHKHEIWTEKDRLKWENDNNLIWQYVDKVDLYKGKCKFCKNICNGAYMDKINLHLRKEHSQEIRATVQKEIANKSLWQYFEFDEEKFIARCKCCNVILNIFYGIDALIHHFCEMNKSLRSRQEPEDNDVNRMTQQSIVTGNANTSFYHDDINRQAPRNQDQQSDYTTSVFYSNTGINDLRSHYQHHINENLRYEIGAADNNEYRMMQQEVTAENMATRYHHESIYWHDLKNQEGQQSSEENYTNNTVSFADDVSNVSSHDGTNWQALGYQIDQQSFEGNNMNNIVFHAHGVSDISFPHDSTN